MPMYQYRCGYCGRRKDVLKSLAMLDRMEQCPGCAQPMAREVVAPRIAPDYPGYECPVTGKWIEGRRAHEENLARTGCRVLETGEVDAFRARQARENAEFDAKVEQTAGELVAALPQDKREALESGLSHGLDYQLTRN